MLTGVADVAVVVTGVVVAVVGVGVVDTVVHFAWVVAAIAAELGSGSAAMRAGIVGVEIAAAVEKPPVSCHRPQFSCPPSCRE